jgi:hypothetical protein
MSCLFCFLCNTVPSFSSWGARKLVHSFLSEPRRQGESFPSRGFRIHKLITHFCLRQEWARTPRFASTRLRRWVCVRVMNVCIVLCSHHVTVTLHTRKLLGLQLYPVFFFSFFFLRGALRACHTISIQYIDRPGYSRLGRHSDWSLGLGPSVTLSSRAFPAFLLFYIKKIGTAATADN